MSGDLLSLLVAMMHVLIEKNPEYAEEVRRHAEYYRQYVFVDGVESKDAMDRAFAMVFSTIRK